MNVICTGIPDDEPRQAIVAPGFDIEGFVLGDTVAEAKGDWALKDEDGYPMLPRRKNQLNARRLG